MQLLLHCLDYGLRSSLAKETHEYSTQSLT